jgi:hypothetical protein
MQHPRHLGLLAASLAQSSHLVLPSSSPTDKLETAGVIVTVTSPSPHGSSGDMNVELSARWVRSMRPTVAFASLAAREIAGPSRLWLETPSVGIPMSRLRSGRKDETPRAGGPMLGALIRLGRGGGCL